MMETTHIHADRVATLKVEGLKQEAGMQAEEDGGSSGGGLL